MERMYKLCAEFGWIWVGCLKHCHFPTPIIISFISQSFLINPIGHVVLGIVNLSPATTGFYPLSPSWSSIVSAFGP